MINIKQVFNNDRSMKAATGMSFSEFAQMLESFGQELETERSTEYENRIIMGDRKRRPGGGRIGSLKTIEDKLFFILFYFKCYPTFDVLGSLFDLNRSNAFRNVQKLTAVLEKVLAKKMTLPKQKIDTFEELVAMFPGVNDLFIDGTERPIQRPKDAEKQKENYSGKKKAHTRKNIIISDENKRIGYISSSAEGKKHDYAMFKDIFSEETFPKDITF